MMKCALVIAIVLAGLSPAWAQPDLTLQGNIAPGLQVEPLPGALYQQLDNCELLGTINSQNFTDPGGVFDNFDDRAADDFVVPANAQWSIGAVQAPGVYGNPIFTGGPASSVNVFFFADAGGLPGAVVAQALNVVPVAGLADGLFVIDLPTSVVLGPGTYWISVQSNQSFVPQAQWFWQGHALENNESAWENPGDGFGTGCTTFTTVTTCAPVSSPDRCFAIIGETPAPAPAMSGWILGVAIVGLAIIGGLAVRRQRTAS